MILIKIKTTNHFIHAFTSIPMEKGLSTEHSCKLFRNTFEEFLNSCAVTYKKPNSYLFFFSFKINVQSYQ